MRAMLVVLGMLGCASVGVSLVVGEVPVNGLVVGTALLSLVVLIVPRPPES